MNTFTFTDAELNAIKQAVEQANDMHNDIILEPLFMSEDCKTITKDQMNEIRKEVNDNMKTALLFNKLVLKLGGKLNDAGFSA